MRKISEEREKELDKTCPIAAQEIIKDGCEKLKEFIKEHDDYINYALWHGGLVKLAIESNNIKALKIFLDAGVHPDTILHPGMFCMTLLEKAIARRAYHSAVCLLDAGANINYTYNGVRPSPLVKAAGNGDLQLVKLFLERGADLHYTYYYGEVGSEKLNALKQAVRYDHQEVADYLRSLGAVMPEEEERPPQTPAEEMLADLTNYFEGKPLPLSMTEIVPASVPMRVHTFPPVEGIRENTVFVTSGLIEYVLTVPEGEEIYWYAEYFIEMPGAWPVKKAELCMEENFWPIRWLKAIGRYPHEQETYYGVKTTVTSEMIPELTTPDGKYGSALVERCQDMTFRVTQDQRLVIYYRITPQ